MNILQFELQNSLKWFQSAFLVEKSQNPVEIQDIYAKIPEYQKFTSVLVQVIFDSSIFEKSEFFILDPNSSCEHEASFRKYEEFIELGGFSSVHRSAKPGKMLQRPGFIGRSFADSFGG